MSQEHELAPDETLLFLHIPKTAGTSIDTLLAEWMGQAAYLRIDQRYVASIEFNDFIGKRLISGHIIYDTARILFGYDPTTLTFLRDPVERWLSMVGQQRWMSETTGTILPGYEMLLDHSVESLIEPINVQKYPWLWNVQSMQIGTSKAQLLRDLVLKQLQQNQVFKTVATQDSLDRALTLIERFAVLGLTERFDDSLALLCYTFGWPLPPYARAVNVSGKLRPRREQLAPAVLDRVEQLHALDRQLYTHAQALFERRFTHMQQDLLERFGGRRHAHMALPLPREELSELLLRHYRQRFEQRHVPQRMIANVFDGAWPHFGFWAPEQNRHGAFRWIGPQTTALLDLALDPRSDFSVAITVAATLYEQTIATFQLLVNDHVVSLAWRQLPEGRYLLSGRIIAEIIAAGAGLTRLALRVAQTLRPAAIDPESNDERELGIAIGEVTLQAVASMQESATPSDADAPLFFLHIPKTAGTSLNNHLARQIGQEASPNIYDETFAFALEQVKQTHYLAGHISYDEGCTLLGREPIGLTMLRDPVQRWASNISQYQRIILPVVAHEQRRQQIVALSLLELCDPTQVVQFPHLWNVQTRLLGQVSPLRRAEDIHARYQYALSAKQTQGRVKGGLPTSGEQEINGRLQYMLGPAHLARAKNQLARLAWFGITERFAESLELLCYTLDWPISSEGVRLNVAPAPARNALADPELATRLRVLNEYDIELYAFAHELFDQRYAAMRHDLIVQYGDAQEQATGALTRARTHALMQRRYMQRLAARPPIRELSAVPGIGHAALGWYPLEQDKHYGAMRWSGPVCSALIDIRLDPASDYWLEVEVIMAQSADQVKCLAIDVNQRRLPLACASVPGRGWVLRARIPAAAIRATDGVARMTFTVQRTWRPLDVDPSSQDDRALGIAVGQIRIVPASEAHGTPIYITGITHGRVAQMADLLSRCGVAMLQDAGPAALSAAALAMAGAAWDLPPHPRADLAQPAICAQGQALAATLAQPTAWGWHDPRGALAAGFWNNLLPDLRVLICVQHPLTFARTLCAAHESSLTFWLKLWRESYQRLLADIPSERRVVIHYDALLRAPSNELRRVLDALGLAADAQQIALAGAQIAPGRCQELTPTAGETRQLDPGLRQVYMALCAEAGLADVEIESREGVAMSQPLADDQQLRPYDVIDIHAHDIAAWPGSALIASLKGEAQLLERHQLIRELQRLQVVIGGHHGEMLRVQTYALELAAVLAARDAEIDDFGQELAALREILAARDAEIADFGRELVARDAEIDDFGQELAALREILAARDAEIADFGQELAALREILAARDAEIADFGRELAARDAAIAVAALADAGDQTGLLAKEAGWSPMPHS